MRDPFEQAVDKICEHDKRYDPLAYEFLKEVLAFTLWRAAEGNVGKLRHVSGEEVCLGFRDLAQEHFGPRAAMLMHEWGVRETADIGEMVFLLIDADVFGKQDSDTKEDFVGVFDFEEAFGRPPG